MKFILLFERFNELVKDKVLRTGDLARRAQEHGMKDPLVSDVFDYMSDRNVNRLQKKLKTKWTGVETVHDKDFFIYRGFSIPRSSPQWQHWDNIIGETDSTSDHPIYLAKDQIKLSVPAYSSWSMSPNVAEGYADERDGDIKVLLATNVKSVKTFANLHEIGDESEELIIYPIQNHSFRFKAWRT